jgi:triphosphoribosyl-dephospho-CoA synthase
MTLAAQLESAGRRAVARTGARAGVKAEARSDLSDVLPRHLADLGVAALIDEVTLTPKPGLVDLRSRGAHRDLSWDLMCHSAWALHPTFMAMAQAGCAVGYERGDGEGDGNLVRLREQIGAIGRDGEAVMMQATGGVNTHRGAIWALGLLVTAAAVHMTKHSAEHSTLHNTRPINARQADAMAPAKVALNVTLNVALNVAQRAGALARMHDRFAPVRTGNNGERARREHGVGGAVTQAQAGFPHVIKVALPALAQARRRGESEDAARLTALLAIIARLDDTCVLSRGGAPALLAVQTGAAAVLAAGADAGASSVAGKAALQQFDAQLLERHLSPGGAADLLAATLFLDRIAIDGVL